MLLVLFKNCDYCREIGERFAEAKEKELGGGDAAKGAASTEEQ